MYTCQELFDGAIICILINADPSGLNGGSAITGIVAIVFASNSLLLHFGRQPVAADTEFSLRRIRSL